MADFDYILRYRSGNRLKETGDDVVLHLTKLIKLGYFINCTRIQGSQFAYLYIIVSDDTVDFKLFTVLARPYLRGYLVIFSLVCPLNFSSLSIDI